MLGEPNECRNSMKTDAITEYKQDLLCVDNFCPQLTIQIQNFGKYVIDNT